MFLTMASDRQCLCKCTKYARKFSEKKRSPACVYSDAAVRERTTKNEDNDNTTRAMIKETEEKVKKKSKSYKKSRRASGK